MARRKISTFSRSRVWMSRLRTWEWLSRITYVGSSFWVQEVQSACTVHCSVDLRRRLKKPNKYPMTQNLFLFVHHTDNITSSRIFPRTQMSILHWFATDNGIAEKGESYQQCYLKCFASTYLSLSPRKTFFCTYSISSELAQIIFANVVFLISYNCARKVSWKMCRLETLCLSIEVAQLFDIPGVNEPAW